MTVRAARLALALCAGAIALSAHAQQGRPLDFGQMQIKTTRLSDNLYVAEAAPGVGNVVFLTGKDGILLVDSMFPQLHDKLIAAIRATVVPTQVAAQLASKQYVDSAVGNVVHVTGAETISGAKNR